MIPSGYSEDKVYSAVPTDGSGDLSFTRASNGTRINSAGLVEVTPWNLLGQSEALNNAAWTDFGTGVTVTANATTAPNGTSTADKLEFPTSSSGVQYVFEQIINLEVGVPYTFSFYAKAVSGTITNLVVRVNGAEVALGQTITTEWQRFTKTLTPTIASDDTGFKNRSDVSGSGTAINVYIWGCQLNIGSTAKPYFPTTDRLNVPRLTYQNGGGGCPSLLLEKQSTNLILWSEQFDNAAWDKRDATISANQTTSPDGTQNADKFIPINGTQTSWVLQDFSPSAGVYTYSMYVKSSDFSFVQITGSVAFANEYQNYNIANGTLASYSGAQGSIQSMGNGWYRLIYTLTATASGPARFILTAQDSGTAGRLDACTGNGTKFISIWGAQLEQSTYPTSYIPTTSASATRIQDICNKTGISSLIGQTEGTMFIEFNAIGSYDANNMLGTLSDGSANNRIFLNLTDGVGNLEAVITTSGVLNSLYVGTPPSIGRHKVAMAYKNNDVVVYLDGVLMFTDTSVSIPATSKFSVGSYFNDTFPFNSGIGETILFPTRLTNAELASLTTI